ncbi:MAG: mechanosensitive ion channel [Candidatus Omnitrophica bacterium]|nr:mechanosensitive ion channel [Candidatus Omnitrophota bacterium]
MRKIFNKIFISCCVAFFLFSFYLVFASHVEAAPDLPDIKNLANVSIPVNNPALIQKKIIETVGVSIFAYLLLFALIGITNKRVRNIKTRHVVRKNIIYMINFLLIGSIFLIWIQNIGSVTLVLGFASAGLALALQEAILCVAGWFLIITRRPFEVGNRIEINGVRGDVIDIRLFQTSLLEIGNWVDADQSTGRIANVPNSYVFKSQNYNYNRGFDFIWNEIPILVTFESNWQKGRDIIMGHAKNYAEGQADDVRKKIEIMKNRYMIYYGKLTPIVYVNIKDSGVELTLRYLTEAKKRRSSQDGLCRAILQDFAQEPTVNFAYPTYRIVKD